MKKESNQLIEYKKSIFYKIKNFLKNIFGLSKDYQIRKKNGETEKNEIIVPRYEIDFKDNIKIKSDVEKQRVLDLKNKYDKEKIYEDELTMNDIDSLINLYNEETEFLNKDTENRKINIKNMLNELNTLNNVKM